MIRRFGPALALGLLTLAAFAPVLDAGFINLDDPTLVVENAALEGGITGASLRWAFTTILDGNWHPVTWISHLADVGLFGMEPRGHHATSLLIHGAAVLVLYAALLAMTGSPGGSFVAAALFGLHPLRVESVAWVSERKDVLAAFFLAATLLAYAAWVRRRTAPRYLLLVAAYALGLMSKASVVPAPLLLLLLDRWPLRRAEPLRRLVAEKVPLALLAAAVSAVTLQTQRSAGAIGGADAFPPGLRLANAAVSLVRYLAKTVLPIDLAPFYPYPAAIPWWQVAGALAVIAAITAAALYAARRRPAFLVGWAWFLLALAPVLGLIPVGSQAMADRYSYLPSIGLAMAAVWGFGGMLSGRRRLAALLALAVLAPLPAMTFRQAGLWKESGTLFAHALEVTGENAVASFCLGEALEARGDLAGAEANYRIALGRDPRAFKAANELAMILAEEGRHREAIPIFVQALQASPGTAEIWNNLGISLAATGRREDARQVYLRAIGLNPAYSYPVANLVTLCRELGDAACAEEQLRRLRVIDPGLAERLSSAR